jgi:hypothetical protein
VHKVSFSLIRFNPDKSLSIIVSGNYGLIIPRGWTWAICRLGEDKDISPDFPITLI